MKAKGSKAMKGTGVSSAWLSWSNSGLHLFSRVVRLGGYGGGKLDIERIHCCHIDTAGQSLAYMNGQNSDRGCPLQNGV